ncbi:MAG: hypothetical protein CBC35_00070 [Planctomycetes bacterium TMED75]|nr:hypothetical protein [Planctomycetaceae bacterium]MAJ47387.1 hypothetical protein [Planctomycetaceae bacterium]OUU91721.1 MAG: hypothetical protein CBC35_09075 [Planctomycetes bacterium TMED75]OUU96927.1 MAG: hypothetical protein CBC35_00070 [Planctomycetes bacterium TMED75]
MTSVGIVQTIIPHYRQPVFADLAARDGIDLTLYAQLGTNQGSLKGMGKVEEYATVDVTERALGPFIWDPGNLKAARARHDVLIFSWKTRSLLLPRAIRIARRSGSAVVVWGHGFSKTDSPMRRRMRLKPALMADACLFYDHTNAGKSAEDGIEPGRVFAAPNAVDQRGIESAKAEWLDEPGRLEAFQKREGIDPSKTFIFISRLEPDKRLDVLLRAMKLMLAKDPALTLIVVGDGAERDSIESLARTLGVQDSVRFLGAIYDEAELAGWCLSALCMAYPGAVGLTAMHAFGYGLPMVTTDLITCHGPEINAIRDGENGMLYRDGDFGDLAEKLLEFSCNPDLRARMSAAAADSVRGETGWTIPNMVNGFVKCIEAVQTMKKAR